MRQIFEWVGSEKAARKLLLAQPHKATGVKSARIVCGRGLRVVNAS